MHHAAPARRPTRASAAPLVAVAVLVGFAQPARAVIIQTLSGTDNTTAPADDPGFANVGYSNNYYGTAIYLGNGWVLTAGHVGGTGIVLSSGTYLQASGSNTSFTLVNDSPGRSTYTDLYMFKLATEPVGLPSIPIASSMPARGDPVVMIGGGRDRGAFTQWNVVTSTTGPWSWTPTPSGGNFAGFFAQSSRAIRWGTNTIESRDFWEKMYWGGGPNDYNEVKSLTTVFDADLGSTEAQAVRNDSGGAVFTKVGGQWQLAGVIYAVATFPQQPTNLNGESAVFGDETYLADLSYYRPQIVAVVPEPSAAALAALAAVVVGVWRSVPRRRP